MHEIEVDGKIVSFSTTEQMYEYLKKHDPQRYEAFMQLKQGNVFSDDYEDIKITDAVQKEDEKIELMVDGVMRKFENQEEMDRFLREKNKQIGLERAINKASPLPTDPTRYNVANGKNRQSPDIKEKRDDIARHNINISNKRHKLADLKQAKGYQRPFVVDQHNRGEEKRENEIGGDIGMRPLDRGEVEVPRSIEPIGHETAESNDLHSPIPEEKKEDVEVVEIDFDQEIAKAPDELKPYLSYFYENIQKKKRMKKIDLIQKFSTCPEEEVFSFLNYIKSSEFISTKKEFVVFGDEIFCLK